MTKVDLDMDYHIPDDFFLSELDKLNFYRELENIETIEELQTLEDSLEAPAGSTLRTDALFLLLRARIVFGRAGVERISKNGKYYVFDFSPTISVDRVKAFLETFDPQGQMVLVSLQKIRIEARYFRDSADFLENFVKK